MLCLRIEEPGHPTRSADIVAPFSVIGGRASFDQYAVVPLHTRSDAMLWVYRDRHGCSAEPDSRSQVLRNGKPMTGFDSFLEGDVFTCGGVTLTVDVSPTLRKDELARLELLVRSGASGREVFLDELEAAGRREEAAYLRAFANFELRGTISAREALEEAAARVDVRFRAQVADAPIDRCGNKMCPKRWSALKVTPHPTERRCTLCSATLHYCDTVPEARVLAHSHQAVVVEPARQRKHEDLDTLVVVG